jgi:hypothetical protein
MSVHFGAVYRMARPSSPRPTPSRANSIKARPSSDGKAVPVTAPDGTEYLMTGKDADRHQNA